MNIMNTFIRCYNKVNWILVASPMDILGRGENKEILHIGSEATNSGTNGPIAQMIFCLGVLAVLGCLITLIISVGKYIISGNGQGHSDLKTAFAHKLLIVIMIGCGFTFLNLVRKIAIALVDF